MNLIILILLLLLLSIKFSISKKIIYEAEDGILNNIKIYKNIPNYSGKGYVGLFEKDGDSVTITINITEIGYYNIYISYLANLGTKTNDIIINGQDSISFEFPENTKFEEVLIGCFYLKKGDIEIIFKKNWGWMYIDYLAIENVEQTKIDFSKFDKNLVNPNATASAKKLYQYLLNNYGKKIISGQTGKAGEFCEEYANGEIDYIQKLTNKMPALWNTDFIFESKDIKDQFQMPNYVQNGLNWWKKYNGKGILSIQWHWNMKGKMDESPSFYSNDSTFDIEQAVIENTWEYNKVIVDIDHIASILKQLQDVNMPVIWRPLHENDGNWFWWGGSEHSKACSELWKLLYEKLVYEHNINNLIWLWNGKLDENTPYEYIDLVGLDIYSTTHGSHRNEYIKALTFFNNTKMIVLSENGKIPDIDKCVEEEAWWGYFMTWNQEYILTEDYNDKEFVKSVYNNSYVITMNDLPSFNVENYEDNVTHNNDTNGNNNNTNNDNNNNDNNNDDNNNNNENSTNNTNYDINDPNLNDESNKTNQIDIIQQNNDENNNGFSNNNNLCLALFILILFNSLLFI